ncbi:type III restriction-modification system endonuclease [Corynebacterium breve]|uniref:Type III restriction-modification system endonuclease n=1 Tax=Corynebacterium breve TaxID=3049799 RepID=A0ABY8VIX5_9CORY|nr:type III restriction-modification system endonuclease [Corynebacterium breve]WIM68710.1 type III restriction-modification system endonuclease [Corynebacterium breve]
MQIRLQTLEHQQSALRAVNKVFDGVELDYGGRHEANPVFDPADPQLRDNIHSLQIGQVEGVDAIPSSWRGKVDDGVLGIDVKMETGTGKTLVYTQMMHELNRLYGFNKFIVLVPSTPIKEGARSFMQADYARQYFNDAYGGRIRLDLDVLDPQKRSKGRKLFPSAIANFVSGSRLTKGRISALLMTDGMLLSKATMAADYDQMVLGSSSVPYEALAQTRPIVIIDEPHRFKRENKAYEALLDQIQPQAIIRFGATFPELGKTKQTDYNNLIFNLGAIEAFNEQLVKGVAIQYPEAESQDTVRLKLTNLSASKPKTATFQNVETGKSVSLGLTESLGSIAGDFAGLTVEAVGKTPNPAIKSGVTLSNDQVLARGDIISANVYSDTYQALMMRQALDNHFGQEWKNFRRASRIKTLSLFFIDAVESYRGVDGSSGHLRQRFEELLEEKLRQEIKARSGDSSSTAKQYVKYLEASLGDILATNGGYFSADNSTADEAIQREVDQILRDKQKLLAFEDADGQPNTMRFIFSKWTLREGWDNPNVFQIVKLRSSGSDISKLQEVGRGLRLPVDVSGTRLSGEQFYLTYLVDYTERDFAQKLVSEVNSDVGEKLASVKGLLEAVGKQRGKTVTELMVELLTAGYIDADQNIVPEKADEFFAAYPEFTKKRLQPDKIVEDKSRARVGIRQDRYHEIKQLWEKVNDKYYLRLDDLTDAEVDQCIADILDQDVYQAQLGRFAQDVVISGEDGELETRSETKATFDATEPIPYGQWLQLAYKQTYLPVSRIHHGLVEKSKSKKISKDFSIRRRWVDLWRLSMSGWSRSSSTGSLIPRCGELSVLLR